MYPHIQHTETAVKIIRVNMQINAKIRLYLQFLAPPASMQCVSVTACLRDLDLL